MRKVALGGAVAALLAVLLIVPGCNSANIEQAIAANKPLILQTIQVASGRGAEEGLKAWAAKNPGAAKDAAIALDANLDTFLAYLNGDHVGSSQVVNETMNTTLFTNVPPDVKMAILAASAVLDLYLPAPDSGTVMSADQIDYLRAFVTGLKNGVKDFNTKNVKRNWLH